MTDTQIFPEFSAVSGAPASFDLPALANLTRRLDAVNYSYDGIAKLLGKGAFTAMARDQIIPGRLKVHQIRHNLEAPLADRQLATTVALFMLGEAMGASQIDSTLGHGAAQLLDLLNLLEPSPAETHEPQFRASVDLRPHAANDGTELWVASDLGAHQRPGVLRKNHVLGIGQASLSLAQFTERTPIERALDLGTGCGIQTFHLLAHARHVTATDISVRALAFTRFNLLLNATQLGLDPQNLEQRVSLKQGSLTEPVADEVFDLIVSNPPFVITPRHTYETVADRYIYRDGGLAGDGIVSALIQQLPAHLVPGGRAQMLGNWEIPATDETDWTTRLREMVGQNTEAWFIQREVLSPEQYAETWLHDASENRDPELFESAYTDYLKDFAQRGVDSVGFGMIWLRSPVNTNVAPLRRFEEITHPIQQPIAPFITEAIATHDTLAPLSDDALTGLHLTVAVDVTEERHSVPGAEHPGVILLRQGAGLRRTILESTETAGFVSACDGELSVGQIIGALASLLSWGNEEEQKTLLSYIRELCEKGFLRIDSAH